MSLTTNEQIIVKKLLDKLVQIQRREIERYCEKKVKANLWKIKYRLDPEQIIRQGYKMSFYNRKDDKKKWRQCFKMIVNPAMYLSELMYSEPEIIFRSNSIKSSIRDAQQIVNQGVKKEILRLQQLLEQKKFEKILNYLQDFFHGTEINFHNYEKIIGAIINHLKLQFISLVNSIISEKIYNTLEEIIITQIQENIKKQIIGCTSRCHGCGSKCKKNYNHTGGHQVIEGYHLMCAFGGIHDNFSKQPIYDICFTQIAMKKECVSFEKTYSRIIQNTSQKKNWKEHFKTGKYQSTAQESNFLKIWACIQDMLLKYKYPFMRTSAAYCFLKDQSALNDSDMQQKYINFKGEATCLKDFLHI